MTEKEMIEEILIEENNRLCSSIDKHLCAHRTCKQCLIERVAERLSAKYQPKLPEGSVVLSKEEYSNYLVLKNDYAHAKEQCEKLQADNERLYKNIGKFKESVRKETAKEILKAFENRVSLYYPNGLIPYYVFQTVFERVAKQFSVEVEE